MANNRLDGIGTTGVGGHTRRVGVLELVLQRLPLAPGERLDESQGLGIGLANCS
jgi:hypothetical protein